MNGLDKVIEHLNHAHVHLYDFEKICGQMK